MAKSDDSWLWLVTFYRKLCYKMGDRQCEVCMCMCATKICSLIKHKTYRVSYSQCLMGAVVIPIAIVIVIAYYSK